MSTPASSEPLLRLNPTIECLRKEYVLVQAWKKVHDYVRYHNWYADVLDLDMTTATLPAFIKDLQEMLKYPEKLKPDPLRLVLAPKRAKWTVTGGKWEPPKEGSLDLRPLAHTTLKDQTLAVAMMMCLADVVETKQGDPAPEGGIHEARAKETTSYGNRLFCDPMPDKTLRYRWANASAYRKWHQDYKAFVKRPRQVASREFPNGRGFAIVHADLNKFYDNVKPAELLKKVKNLIPEGDEGFLKAFENLFDWKWSYLDDKLRETDIHSHCLEEVALPQGLVASGFFANLYLLDLIRKLVPKELESVQAKNREFL